MNPGLELADVNARRAIDAPADAPLLAVTGRAASGKTETLARRYVALLGRDAGLAIDATIVTAPRVESAAALAGRIDDLLPPARLSERTRGARYVGVGLDRLAFDILADHATLTGLAYDLEAIDVYDAQEIFERAIAPLFSADWNEYLGPDIDPEIPGLRAPERFAAAVLRLIRKLRGAQMSPDAFLAAALRGANAFYAAPPNLASPSLLMATKDEHRGALAVAPAELERQRRRELDLAKIIAKVYRSYLDGLVRHGCLTPPDAIAEATRVLDEHPAVARQYRGRFRLALVDDAHDLHQGEFQLLTAIFGKTLPGVTIAGDPAAATQTFAGARPDRIFGAAEVTLRLQANYRIPAQIAATIQALLDPHPPVIPGGSDLLLHRAATPADEAVFVAERIAAQLAAGTPAGRIAVLHRSLRTLAAFEDALVDRDIPVALHGDAALFARHDTLDALSLLHATVDPFAHDWLLRVLQLPFMGLSDATLAVLCGEPASPQGLLFDLPPEENDGSRRWDRRRELRLGTNVVRGDRDADLDPLARERLTAFRARRIGWQHVLQTADVAAATAAIVTGGGMFERRPGETAARARRRADVVGALLTAIGRHAARNPGAGVAAALAYCERIGGGESGPELDAGPAADAVVVASIDRVKARRFEHVYVVDVRAGSFPPYYVPDAFLFSPTYGMIPKDSVGEAVTARTAKFTWYAHHAKLRENYSREDRRALGVALGRADATVTVTAAGRPTRGAAAPELLVELQALRVEPAPVNAAQRSAAPAGTPAPDAARFAAATAPALDAGSQPAAAVPACVPAERVAEMSRCVRCAPRRTIAATLEASFTLLSGRLPPTDARVEARDVGFAFPLGPAVVVGTVPALLRHQARLYVVTAQLDAAAAALAIHGLPGRVAADGFFVETADGVFSGPHPVDVDETIARAAEILGGTRAPLCGVHRQT